MNWLLIVCMTPALLLALFYIGLLIAIDRQEAKFKKRFHR